ncbi:unnamed protein product, partial [Cladocopium goreaui]
PTQQNTGFGAAAFSSALGLGSASAPTSGATKNSAFDLLGNQRPQGHMQQRFVPQSPNVPMSPAQSNQLVAQALNQALTGEKKNIPVWNGQPSTLRSWLKLLALWEHESQMPMERRGVKLLQSFAEGSEPRRIADTVPMHVLLSPSGYSSVLSAIYEKYFPYLEASAPKAVDKFIYEGERQKAESFTSFIASKQLARQEMESQLGEVISDRLCGRILLRQAGLNEFQREMLMLRGPALRTFDEVATMLRTLDRPEMLVKAQSGVQSRNYAAYNMDGGEDQQQWNNVDDVQDDDDELVEDSSSQDEEGHPFIYFEDRTFNEEETVEILAYHSAYRDVRKELQKRRNERGYVKRGHDSGSGKGKGKRKGPRNNFGKGKSKFSKGTRYLKSYEDDLLSRTRCFNCDELGHMSKDCPFKNDQNKKPSPGSNNARKQFLMTSTGPQVFMHNSGYVVPSERSADRGAPYRLMIFHAVQCRPDEALVDTAAEEAVIGHHAMEMLEKELKKKGLRPQWQRGGNLPGAGGIGGAATVKGAMVNQETNEETPVISVWLLVDEQLHHLQDLPSQGRLQMVLPQECALIQDPATLEPERLTHAFLQGGRHMVIRDYWQDARASRQLDEQWHGAVIFASNQHVVVNTSGSVSNQPVIADETTRRAFTHVSSSSSSAAPSSSSTWANTARREFGHGGKRADDQDGHQSIAAAASMQVPSGPIFEFDLASCDEHLAEVCDDSPVFDLRPNSISNKQVLGWLASIFFPNFVAADRLMTNTWSHEAGSAESTNAEKPFQMLKDLIFNHNLWCPRRFRNEQSSRVLQTDGEERSCRTNQSSITVQAGDNLEKDEDQKDTKKDRKSKDPKSVVRQAIGKPLSRSKAQTAWNREVSECIHEEEYLRHRAGKGHFWYTCLQCGGRWERLQSQASSSTQVIETTVPAENFPKFLPAPRSRPDLKTQKVTINQLPKAKAVTSKPSESRGRTLQKQGSEKMIGLMPVQRSKTPTPDPSRASGSQVEVFTLAGNDMDEVEMVTADEDFSAEEIAMMNADWQRDMVESATGLGIEYVSALEREHILDP